MTFGVLSFSNSFATSRQPEAAIQSSSSAKQLVFASNIGGRWGSYTTHYTKVARSGLFMSYIEGYADTVVQVYSEQDQTEKWYVRDDYSGWIEIDPDQGWFWTQTWQQGEKRADEDLRLGRYQDFEDIEDLFE